MSPIWLFSLPKPFPLKYIFQTLCLANIRQRNKAYDVFKSFLKSVENFLSREPILYGEDVNVKIFLLTQIIGTVYSFTYSCTVPL